MTTSQNNASAQTVASSMVTTIPFFTPTTTCGDALKALSKDIEWDDIHHIYVVDKNKKLLGFCHIATIVQQKPLAQLGDVIKKAPETLSPTDDQEVAVYAAIKNDFDALPVTSDDGVLLGAITAKSIINIMHQEHVEDALYAAGIRKNHNSHSFVHLVTARLMPVLGARAPWLIVGALVGIALGLISSQFEQTLEKTIALAYFVPVVAYIADSVGTQSEAITIRAMAIMKLNYGVYMLREFTVGAMLGMIMGAMGFIGALLISNDTLVALVVGLSLIAASTMATTMAALIPILFKKFGKDPALGSGPIATALQDMASVAIYFLFAILIIGA